MNDSTLDPVTRAWELCYLDPQAAREIGRQVAEQGGAGAAGGWLHVALAETRVGSAGAALDALARARSAYAAASDRGGLALCDEVRAMQLRRGGDIAASARLQAEIDAREGLPRDPMFRFIGRNSRALTCQVLGEADEALRQAYAARDAAAETGWAGPQITATLNLGGCHHAMFNLGDARRLLEQALQWARAAGARQIVGSAACRLIQVYHAAGEPERARAMAAFMLTHGDEMNPQATERGALPLALGHLCVGEIEVALDQLEIGAAAAAVDGDQATFWAWLKARCLLARGDIAQARELAELGLLQYPGGPQAAPPYDTMQLQRVLADTCEAGGDAVAALASLRQAQRLHDELVRSGARAREIALEASQPLQQSQRERDLALDSRRSVEDDNRRLADLNAALQTQVAETEMLHVKLREQALRDPLTGLHNRRYLFEVAPGLLELARRQGGPLCVVLIDLDHFKLLNDTYGHHAGDLVLQRFANLLTQLLRRSDVICRHGGEEFVAVMPDIDGDGAQIMLGRLLEAFQTQPQTPGRRRLPGGSFSAGIARFPRHGHTLEQLLSRADRALYAAKNHGRARIEQAPRSGFGTLA